MLYRFPDPFRYIPHPLVKEAAGQVLAMLESWREQPDGSPHRELERSFAEGKMLGVLVVSSNSSDTTDSLFSPGSISELPIGTSRGVPTDTVRGVRFIAAFSGTVRGADGSAIATVNGFVPPIIDLTDPDGYFKKEEARISELNRRISSLSSSSKLAEVRAALKQALVQRDQEIAQMQEDIRSARLRRDNLRQKSADPELAETLIRESQFQKAELKRLKDKWKVAVEELSCAVEHVQNEVAELKLKRARMSDELQRWIFENAVVHNGLGESTTIWDIFRRDGLTPPGGTGECAAPKLLEYAFRHGLKPLAMGEFWYGMSPETAVRTHGHFYPSCTSKCGPLLGYMMQGLEQHCKLHSESGKTADKELRIDSKQSTDLPVIIHEDESVIVVEKPSGMPSVPGLDGRSSLQEWLSENQTPSKRKVYSVHRLDMDTSGVMIFAKNQQAAVNLRRQFEEHSVRKTYMARVLASSRDNVHTCIDLPLAPDYDERPRQKVDFKQGKKAHTEYRIVKEYADGTADLLLYPHTGRTHQLRVHCAHTLGLGRPILGDLLYGAHTAKGASAALTEIHREPGSVHHAEPVPSPTTGVYQEFSQTPPSRLCLHALSITFRHPDTGIPITFTSSRLCY